jgi:hypothetical protein
MHNPFSAPSLLTATGALTLLLAAPTAASAQDVLVDNFESGDLISTSWSAEWYGTTNTTPLTNRGFALRAAYNADEFNPPIFLQR